MCAIKNLTRVRRGEVDGKCRLGLYLSHRGYGTQVGVYGDITFVNFTQAFLRQPRDASQAQILKLCWVRSRGLMNCLHEYHPARILMRLSPLVWIGRGYMIKQFALVICDPSMITNNVYKVRSLPLGKYGTS